MAKYSVALTTSATRELNNLSARLIARVVARLEGLVSNPRPPGSKKLWGGDNEWRIRIGDYRVVYGIDETRKEIEVTRIAHRREVYER